MNRARNGFALIEIAIALGILTLLVATSYYTMNKDGSSNNPQEIIKKGNAAKNNAEKVINDLKQTMQKEQGISVDEPRQQ